MIYVVCHTCKQARRCRGRSEMHRDSLLAWAKDLPAPECADYAPRWFRGIEGVYACDSPAPPLHHAHRQSSRKDGLSCKLP